MSLSKTVLNPDHSLNFPKRQSGWELTAPDETRSAAAGQWARLQVHCMVGTWHTVHPMTRTPPGLRACRHLSQSTTESTWHYLQGPTQDQLPVPEVWPDKAMSTISHHLIRPAEWLMKSYGTAADKIRPLQVMKDKACGCEWGAGRFLGQNAAFRWFGTQ